MPTRQIPFDLVVAREINYGIGFNGGIPWKLPSDLRMFRKITTSGLEKNAIIMGRKTFESIGKKPLPHRTNIVISQNTKLQVNQNLKQASTLTQALQLATHLNPKSRIYVIGGQRLFQQSLPDSRFIYQTVISSPITCDVHMPRHDNFKCQFVSKTMQQNQLTFDYRIYRNEEKYKDDAVENHFGMGEHEELQYLRMVKRIIEDGEEKSDRTGTGTRAVFGGMMRYDLRDSFPLLTHKKVFWRGVAEQLLWFIKGSTDSTLLQQKGIHIWDGNSSSQYLHSLGLTRQSGDLGPVYGFQWRHWNAPYTNKHDDYTNKGIDQLEWIIDQIRRNPASRRLILTAWNPQQLGEMALPPCHLLAQFSVSNDRRLSCILYQRSCDMGLGVPFNIASYALLTCLIAQVTGLGRGQLVHMMADMHVYKDHIPSLKDIDKIQPFAFPTLEIDPSIKDIDKFEFKHFNIKNYRSHKKIQMKMSV